LVEPDRSVEQLQARGLGYVHFERVGPRTFTFTSTLDTGSLSSSFTFFRTLDSSPRVDRGRRFGPGIRTLTLTVSNVFATSPSFFFLFLYTVISLQLLASHCVRVFFIRSFLFFRSRRFGSQFVIPLCCRIASPSRIKCRAVNWQIVVGHLGGITKALSSCCAVR